MTDAQLQSCLDRAALAADQVAPDPWVAHSLADDVNTLVAELRAALPAVAVARAAVRTRDAEDAWVVADDKTPEDAEELRRKLNEWRACRLAEAAAVRAYAVAVESALGKLPVKAAGDNGRRVAAEVEATR